jgi:hypothetical protein
MKLGFSRILLLGAAAVVALASAVYVKSQASPQVVIEMGSAGLISLKYGGAELLRTGDFRVNQVLLRKPSGETYTGDPNGTVTVDTAARQWTGNYPWGRIQVSYTAAQNRLTLNIDTRNGSSSDTIQGVWYEPLALRFPKKLKEYDGSIPLLEHSVGNPGILRVSYDSGVLVVTSEDVSKPLLFGFPYAANRPDNTVFPLTANTDRVKSQPDSLPLIDRPIPPGAADRFTISLRFGRPGDTIMDLAQDVYQKYAQAFPARLNWPDRRPIGEVFLASAATNWPKNPRGWLADERVDITTPEGRADFRNRILKLADATVTILRDMNAQGAITWDIEGQEYAQAVGYMGDPRLCSKLAPEMAGVAEEYFKKFRDAGFRVGVCVRPQQLKFLSDKKPTQDTVADPAKVLMDKIKFAKERWGATIIYLGSNVNPGDPNPLDAQVLQKIVTAFPDILLIPEHSNFRYYAYAAPYKELRQGYTSTDEAVRAAYPNAFTFISTVDGPLDYQRKTLTAAVKRGDSVIYRSWYPDPQNEKVKALFRR